jgi:hypothetical protein
LAAGCIVAAVAAYTRTNPKKSEEQTHEPDRCRPRPDSAPSLRDRLKDPSLLQGPCYIDGAWLGTPSRPVTNPVNGIELAKYRS